MDNRALRCSPEEAVKTMAVMQEVKALKSIYRHHLNGWSNDKEKTMKHAARIPLWMIFDKEYSKYFSPLMDRHEDKKHTESFLRKFPQFRVND